MKIAKKILAIALTAILSVTVLAVSASAVDANGDESLTVTVTTDTENYAPEDTVTVTVSIKSNYNLTAFRYPIMFDASVYEMPTLISLTALNSCKTGGTIGSNTSNDGSFIPDNYTASDFGCIVVQWTASVTQGKVGCINAPEGEACFSFILKAKSSAAGKTGTILIPPESDQFYYQAIKDPADATTIYYLSSETLTSSYVPANANVVGEEVGLAANNDYGTPGIVDNDNLWVYGLPLDLTGNAMLKQYVKATGGATIRSTATQYGFGTGATVNLQVDDVIVKTYHIVIFGDLNGDCLTDSNDLTTATSISSLIAELPERYQVFAGDVNGDGQVDSGDLAIYTNVAANIATINQSQPY